MRDEEGIAPAVEILKLLEARVERLNILMAKEKRTPEEIYEIPKIIKEIEDNLIDRARLAETFLKRRARKRQPPDPKIEIVTEKARRIFENLRESLKKMERLRRER